MAKFLNLATLVAAFVIASPVAIVAQTSPSSSEESVEQTPPAPEKSAKQQTVSDSVAYKRYKEIDEHCGGVEADKMVARWDWVREATDAQHQRYLASCRLREAHKAFGRQAPERNLAQYEDEPPVREAYDRRPEYRPPVRSRPAGPRKQHDGLEATRKFLKTYNGPLWDFSGTDEATGETVQYDKVFKVHMNKKAPSTAVPCQPPGYNRVVLCNPRTVRRPH